MDKSKMHQPMTPTPKKSYMVKFFTLKNKFTNFNFQLEKSS